MKRYRVEQLGAFVLVGLLLGVAWYQRTLIVTAFHRVSFLRLSVVLALIVPMYLASAASWRQLLIGLGNRLSYRTVLTLWVLSNIARYVPGTIWQFLGRIYFAQVHGIVRRATVLSLIYEIALLAVTAITLTVTTLPFWPVDSSLPWWVSTVGLGALILLWPSTLSWFVGWISRLRREPIEHIPPLPWLQLSHAFGLTLLRLIFGGTAFWVLASVFLPLGLADLPGAIGMYALAWLVGYVTVFAPAGVGVADGTLAVLLTPRLGVAESLSVVVVFRALLFVGESIVAGLALALYPEIIGLMSAHRSVVTESGTSTPKRSG